MRTDYTAGDVIIKKRVLTGFVAEDTQRLHINPGGDNCVEDGVIAVVTDKLQ